MHKSASELVADITGHIGHSANSTPAEAIAYMQLMLKDMNEKALTQPNIVICYGRYM